MCQVLELQSGKLSVGMSNGDADDLSNRYREILERNQQLEVSRCCIVTVTTRVHY